MAIQTELERGQITPAARPVEAFIQPGQSNVAQPNAPQQFGNPTSFSTINTAGTGSVQGANNFANLAQALAPFSRNLVEFTQSAGLAYAQGQIDDGERRAREQVFQAMAQNDASMESDELKRAALNRALAAKDPKAGEAMAFLNPYSQIGWERGKSKMAGQEAASGLPAFIARETSKAPLDYTSPDQGFAQLAQLQAQYTGQLAQRYGLTSASPGFQKYVLPEIEKAQEKVQTRAIADRKKFFDTAAVGQGIRTLESMFRATESSVEWQGQVYTKVGDLSSYNRARQLLAQQLVSDVVLRSSLPGEATERSKEIFQALSAKADYEVDPAFKDFIESIPGNEAARGSDGKPILNPESGKPVMLTWGQLYAQESIDSEIKYGQAGYQNRKRAKEEALEGSEGFEDGLLRVLQRIEGGGPEQAQAADQYVADWYAKNGQALGLSYADLQKRRDNLVGLDAKRYAEFTDPAAIPTFYQEFEGARGPFDAAAWRRQVAETAAKITDPKEKATFLREANQRVASRELEQATFKGYDSTRDSVIKSNIDSNIKQFYGPNPTADTAESRTRQTNAFTAQTNAALLQKEKQLGRKLNESEVRAVTQDVIEGYGRGKNAVGATGQGQLDYLFPGSRRTDEPSVKGSATSNRGVKPTTYGLAQLDKIPDRTLALPNYRRQPVLSAEATAELIAIAGTGKPWPKQFERAWRDARAKSAGEFLLAHVDKYKDVIQVPPEMRQEIMKKTSSAASAGNAMVSRAATAQQSPLISSIGSWALNALTGAQPAVAGTLDSAPRQYGGTGGGRPSQPQAYPLPADYPTTEGNQPAAAASRPAAVRSAAPMVAPAAPVLPAPVSTASTSSASSLAATGPVAALMPGGSIRPGAAPRLAAITDEGMGPSARRRAMRPQLLAVASPDPSSYLGGGWDSGPAVAASHADSGSGYTVPGARDANGRPPIFSRGGANAFAAMVRDSGGVVKASDIASSQRSAGKNAAVGGANGSEHLKGNAMDIHGKSEAWIRKNGAKYGWFVHDYDGSHGGHFEFRGGGSAAPRTSSIGGSPDGYMKRLAYLETRIRNIPNSEGSEGRGYFQAFNKFNQEAVAASGGISPRDPDYSRSARASWAWIEKYRPAAAAAIRRGDYDTADRILRPTWPSLPGGDQEQKEQVQREARRYLSRS